MCARSLSFLPSFVPFPPKASGSSLLAKITHYLVADALGQAGLLDLGAVTVLPLATGMALTMTLLALNSMGRGDGEEHVAGRDGVSGSGSGRMAACRRVLWSRIDQKTCLKAITAAGLEPEVIELLPRGDELVTDVEVGESWSSTCLTLPASRSTTVTSCQGNPLLAHALLPFVIIAVRESSRGSRSSEDPSAWPVSSRRRAALHLAHPTMLWPSPNYARPPVCLTSSTTPMASRALRLVPRSHRPGGKVTTEKEGGGALALLLTCWKPLHL